MPAPAERFRYGVIGTGMMGVEHIENVNHIPGAVVTAYADPHEASRVAAHTLTDDATGFEDYRDLLVSDLVDAVVIATPNHTHAAVLEAALATDLHVLVEKPLCTTIEDCRRVIEVAKDRRAVTWMGLEYRYMPPVTRLIREVQAGTVGDLRMVAIREHRFPFLRKIGDWNRFNRNSGGTMVEKCCHFFDLMNELVDGRPVRVVASGGQDVNHLDEVYDGAVPDVLDNAYVIVEYDNGVRTMLDLCMFAEATRNQEEVVAVGTRGKVEAFLPEKVIRIGRRGTHFVGDVEEYHVDDERITYHGHHHGSSQLEHLDFIAACQTGSTPAVTLEDGMLAVAMGLAAQASLTRHTWVDLNEILEPVS
jgi:myo-inositol 2-dehydrogenase / D-chiro-inositol 1-dehydrogenase